MAKKQTETEIAADVRAFVASYTVKYGDEVLQKNAAKARRWLLRNGILTSDAAAVVALVTILKGALPRRRG